MHNAKKISLGGKPLAEAKKVMVMIHGRGATAPSILSLSQYFKAGDMAFVAPQATGGSWYPYSFMTPMEENEPYLSLALDTIGEVVENLKSEHGFKQSDIYLLGFSQGACLSLEFTARHAGKYGGVFALSGGLIGPVGTPRDYKGSMDETPVFLGCSDVDFHIPKDRVLESGAVFEKLNANVNVQIYKNFGHSVNDDEIAAVNQILLGGKF